MNIPVQNQPARPRFAGVLKIAHYNWPQYVCAMALILTAAMWWWLGPNQSNLWRVLFVGAAMLAGWWSFASLAASYWIYDWSELYRWTWIPSMLARHPKRWLNLHAGLDESSAMLHQLFPTSAGQTGDFYAVTEMTEPSIRRARVERGRAPAGMIDYRHLPYSDRMFDAVFLLFAAHELRHAASREAFFGEIARVLGPGGTVLLVEHARDLANFAAFGPGFLHFLPAKEWERLAGVTGLKVMQGFRLTPFVRIMLLWR